MATPQENRNGNPILVTGSSYRSGTTWAGRMLAYAPGVAYIHEPFNDAHVRRGINPKPFNCHFKCIRDENVEGFDAVFVDILRYKYSLLAECSNIHSFSLKDAARLIRGYAKCARFSMGRYRPLVKDPTAFYSAEWLAQRLNMQVVVLIRHSCGVHFKFEDHVLEL